MANHYDPKQPRGHVSNPGSWSAKTHSDPEVTLTEPNPLQRRYDTLEEKLHVMRQEIEDTVAALDDDENWQRYLDACSRWPRYSFGNQLLIAVQNKEGDQVAGKKVWASLGRKVRPAADRGPGISILAPRKAWVAEKDKDGKPVTGADGEPVKRLQTIGFTTCTVYAAHQTEGDPLPDVQRELSEEPPEGLIDDLETVITAYGYTVKDDPNLGGAFGATNPKTMTVRIDPSLTPGSRAQVLAHELGHIAAGHTERTGEYHTGADGQRGAMEVEAESISHVLLRMNGMATPGEVTGTYVAGWARTQVNDPDVIRKSGEKVTKTVRQLLEERSWRNVIV